MVMTVKQLNRHIGLPPLDYSVCGLFHYVSAEVSVVAGARDRVRTRTEEARGAQGAAARANTRK